MLKTPQITENEKREITASTLFVYLRDNKQLVEFNMQELSNLPYGKLFFLFDKDSVLVNVGITLEDNTVATVLETDKNLKIHSFEQVKEYYKEKVATITIQR